MANHGIQRIRSLTAESLKAGILRYDAGKNFARMTKQIKVLMRKPYDQ